MGNDDDWDDDPSDPRVWVVRAPNGKQWKPASFGQVVSGLGVAGKLSEDMEVSHVQQPSRWEPIGTFIARMRRPSQVEATRAAEARLASVPPAPSRTTTPPQASSSIPSEAFRGAAMHWIDRIEKVGRVVLWLAIASAFVIVPVSYISQKRAETKTEAELHEAVKNAEARAEALEKEKDKKPNRLTLASMGAYVYGINYSLAQGNLTFTNVSPRTGVLCVIGEAQEPDLSMKTSQSIPACAEVGEYKTVHLPVQFAGGDLTAACPKANCKVTFKEAPESKE